MVICLLKATEIEVISQDKGQETLRSIINVYCVMLYARCYSRCLESVNKTGKDSCPQRIYYILKDKKDNKHNKFIVC